MNKLLKVLALIGLAGTVYAGPSSPPAGNYITNVSTIAAKPAFNVSSGTIRDQLKLSYISTGSVLGLNSAGVVVSTTVSGGGGATLSIPNTAVAIGTSSNTVTGDATVFSASLLLGQMSITNLSGSAATLILDGRGFGPLDYPYIKFQDNGGDVFSFKYSNQNNPESRLYFRNDQSGVEILNFSLFNDSITALTPFAFRGTVRLSSGVLCGTSAGTLGQFLTSGGAGGPCTWTTGSAGGASSLAVASGTASGFVVASSPTAIINFDSSTFAAALTGSATAYVTLNASSVTLQGNNLAATYLTNSSATATYLNQSSATATYLNQTSAAATYLTQANAASTYLSQSSATSTYLQNSSATATYLNKTDATATYLTQSSATATYANKSVFATTTSTGVLTATDWNTFNGKQAAGSYLTAVAVQGPLQGNGTAGSPLFTSTATTTSTGSLTSTDWNTFNNKQASGAYLTAVTAQSPISGNGTAGSPLITSTATATSTGSLTATDWSTFNGKGVGTITGITTQNGIIGGGASGALTISVSSVSLSTQTVGTLGVANGGTGLTAAVNNRVMVGDGSVWVSTTVPSCSDPTASKLLFNSATNTFTCGSDQGGTGAGDNLGNHVATTTLNMATFGISNIGTSSSTFDAAGALTTKSSATLAGSVFISSQVTTTGNYTATGGDSVLYSSVTTSTPTITLPPATNTGQVITIYKVDTSTVPVIIKAAGTDTIVGISTVTLWAYGYQQTLRADGTSTWWPVGRLVSQPQNIGWGSDVAGSAVGVANRGYFYSWRLDDPCDTKTFRYFSGAAVSGNVFFAIYNETGNVMVSSGPLAMPAGTTAGHTITLPKKNLQPGLYYVMFGADNATAAFTRWSSDQVGGQFSKGTMNPPPASIGYPPTFDSATSSRAPTVTVQCYGGPPDL